MKITVHLYTVLKKFGNGKIDEDNSLSLPEPMSLSGLTAHLDIPKKPGKTFLVNNRPRSEDYILQNGDVVKIYGYICGG